MFILQTVYSILQTQYTVNNILKKSADLQLAKIILWPSTARFPEEKKISSGFYGYNFKKSPL